MQTGWQPVFAAIELGRGEVRVVRQGAEQVAVFRLDDGALHAVDNRCPHEGFPLSQGTVCGATLTCCWHNFKFDLTDGSCLKGDEAVRTLGVRERDGVVEVDWTPPDRALTVPKRWDSLDEALHHERVGQACRDIARLLQAGVTPGAILGRLVVRDAARGEWGPSHALAVGADLSRWTDRYAGVRFTIPAAILVELVARATVRRPARPRVEAVDPGPDGDEARRRFLAHVDAEDATAAEGLLRGAFRRWGADAVLPWLAEAAVRHFLDFGHALIYWTKLPVLLAHLDAPGAEELLAGYAFGVVNGTREDLLPAWRRFVRDLDALLARPSAPPDPGWSGATLGHACHRPVVEALDALSDALAAGAPIARILDVLEGEAAERLLRFDPRIDLDGSVQDGWLDATHVVTFTRAVREAVPHLGEEDRVRALAWSVRMIAHHRVLDGERPRWTPRPGTPAELVVAIRSGATQRALDLAARLVGDDPEGLRLALEDLLIDDPATRPIIVAHLLKTTVAAFDAHAATGDIRPVLAAVRMLASPRRERRVGQLAREAVALVTEGRTPRRLAP